MSQQEPPSCFNAFSPFLQEITNIAGSGSLDHENKENVPPAILGRLFDGSYGSRDKNNITRQQQRQRQNAYSVSGCSTPVMIRQRPQHTGLTPGNNSVPETCCRGSQCASSTDASVLLAHDAKDTLFSFSPERQCEAPVHHQSDLSELFQGCVPLLQHPQSANVSLESTLLHRSALMESEDDDNLQEMQSSKRPRPRALPRAGWTTAPTQQPMSSPSSPLPLQSEPQSQRRLQEKRQKQKQKHSISVAPHLFASPQPMPPHASHQHGTPPPEYPRNDRHQNVTQVFRRAAPLIAVGGRRVPIDKLHLLLRHPSPECDSTSVGVPTTQDRAAPAPLVPSARPTPAAVKTIKIVSSHAAVPIPSSRRYPPQYHQHEHHEVIVLEFARGVLMRFQPNHALPSYIVGNRYLAAIRSSRSPYDNVAYDDAGVCVHVIRHYADANGGAASGVGDKGIYDGCIVRAVEEDSPADIAQMRALSEARNVAILECQKHFRFLNLPFELVDVHYTFDKSICVVYYSIHPQEGTSSQPNVPRLIRMLQHKLRCKVYLKTDSCSE